ncbi:MAG: helix-turn-helix transcriptional regulator [Ignavibacteriae bacterium]|nr:helix-turn-helix transcriptional regulator [Ignavibacteriota bacterium]
MNNKNEISQIVKFHRKKSGISQKELADLSGVGKTVVFDIENGKETIRFSTLIKVLKTLNITIDFQSPIMKEYYEKSKDI